MAIRIAPLPEGTRVRIIRGAVPQDPTLTNRTGLVVQASEYRPNGVGVALEGSQTVRWFLPDELEVLGDRPPLPEAEEAKQRKPLP